MIRAGSLYEACGEVFAEYPLAVRVADWDRTVHSIVLMLRNSDDASFFVLTHDSGDGRPFYSLSPWRTRTVVNIEADTAGQPDWVTTVVTKGVPLPRHGSLFGWRCRETISALIAIYTKVTSLCPEPAWTVMPRVGAPETQWPDFTGESLFDAWFWDHYRAKTITSLGSLIAETSSTVFWVKTKTLLGWNSCAVARDIRGSEGYLLPRGCYVYYEALRAGVPIPPLDMLLADPSKTDLAPRFRRLGGAEG